MNVIKEHKFLTAIVVILIIFFVACMLLFYKMFFGYGDDKYGSRLKNIQNIEISNYTISKIETELKDLEKVNSVKYILNGKLINIIFKVDKDLEKDQAKEYGEKVLEYFSDEEKDNYDIQVFMYASEEDGYAVIGYKKAKMEKITWSNN